MQKIKIFITEDEFIVSQNLSNKLALLGYDVVGIASSGEEALEKIKLNQPNLILMDIMLSGKMDGIETAKIIKENYNIPLIFLTAYSSKEIYQRAQITEPYAYIIKPFEERELEINISIALYKHKAEEKLKLNQQRLELLNNNLDLLVQERTLELITRNNDLHLEIKNRIEAQEKESRLIEVIKQAEDHILITNVEGKIEYLNPKMLKFIGCTEKEVYGKTPRILKSGFQPVSFYQDMWKQILAGKIFKGEFVNKRKDGTAYIAQEIIVPLRDRNKKISHFASIGRDVTEKRDFEKKMVYLQEKERERISKDLHDGIGQSITATKYSLMALLKNINMNETDRKNIQHVIDQTDGLTKELRTISFELMPSILKDYGLNSVVLKTIKNLNEINAIKITLNYKCKSSRFNENIEIGMYRVFQEALNNAIKHSKASLIHVEFIQESADFLKLIITDNGIGFDLTKIEEGQGLRNMKQRTNLLEGSFLIDSNQKIGTQIIVEVPTNTI